MNINNQLNYHRYQRYFTDVRSLYEKREIVVYTGLILSLFAIAFFGLFALRPTLTTIASLIKETEAKREVDQQLQTKINNLRQAQINYSQVANSVYIVNQALPPNPSLPEIVYPIEILAQRSGLQLTTVNFSRVDLQGISPSRVVQQTTGGSEKGIEFDINVRGDFDKLNSYMNALENMRRLIIIDSFTLRNDLFEEKATMALSIKGRFFYLSKGD
ncbi:MAG: type 4a pilus biogenesis protein PilO [bacterium]|nr:type 4a pilus biogenesis protein PilO [bacterium]